MSYNFDQMI